MLDSLSGVVLEDITVSPHSSNLHSIRGTAVKMLAKVVVVLKLPIVNLRKKIEEGDLRLRRGAYCNCCTSCRCLCYLTIHHLVFPDWS